VGHREGVGAGGWRVGQFVSFAPAAVPPVRLRPGPDAPAWHSLEAPDVAAHLGTGANGITDDEARRRRVETGRNEFEPTPPTHPLVVLAHQFAGPLIAMLLVAAVITVLLGEYLDAAVITAALVLNACIGYVQERRAELSVRSLQDLLAPHARVVRDGREWDVDSRDLVPGDLVLLESGLRVPADVRLAATTNLAVDESLLTGESLAVDKSPARLDAGVPLADRRNLAFTGTIVTHGRGRGYVVATGMATELGEVATRTRAAEKADTPLQQRMARFARLITVAIATACAALFAIGLASGEPARDMFLAAVALAVAAIPEGLPVAFTVALALGVRRMARRRAVVRRLPAVETLGSTTVIVSDKAGAPTENRMTVQDVWTAGGTVPVPAVAPATLPPGPLRAALEAGVLAVEAEAYRTADGFEVHGDPTEGALLVAAARFGVEPEHIRAGYRVSARIPFESERQYSAALCADGDAHILFVVGAPERVIGICSRVLTPAGEIAVDREALHEAARALAADGLRVVAMARGRIAGPDGGRAAVDEPHDLVFLGLQGMLDPPRPGVAEAIADCRASGIRVVMVTGDHAVTALAVARRLGLADPGATVVTGPELAQLGDAALRECVASVPVFARVAPEHKLRIVEALRDLGEVVAVTGDGVNDAPALKRADIGIAMGRGGTDVARETADMVLTDDDFVSIVAAVEEGRVTFGNVRKVTFFLLSTGAAAIFAILTAATLRWPLPLLPAQLLWCNLVTNGLQDVALAFEPGEPGTLQEPPRRRREGVVSARLWVRTALAGATMAAGAMVLYRWELARTGSLTDARTVALTTLVLFMAFHAGNSRSESRSVFRMNPFANRFLLAATAGAVALHACALYWEPTQYVLRVAPVDAAAWVRMVVTASSVLVVVEAHKALARRHARRSPRR